MLVSRSKDNHLGWYMRETHVFMVAHSHPSNRLGKYIEPPFLDDFFGRRGTMVTLCSGLHEKFFRQKNVRMDYRVVSLGHTHT